jgi:hypothetical protein
MPMELHHWVRLRLFAERIVEDGLQRFLVLDNRVLPAAVVGQRVSICLRPEQSGDKVILRPVLRAGDLSFSGEELSVQSSDGSPVGGSLTSLWLEISVLSPFQRPRTETITLADAFPASPDWRTRDEKSLEKTKTLPDRALNVQVDLIVVSGWLSPAVCLERSALALRRIFAASDILPLSAEAVEAIRTTNPILLQWAYTLCTALSGDDSTARAYIDSPAIALVVYLPHGGESKGQVKVMTGLPHFSAVFINESRQPAGLPGMFASRLLQEWAKQSAPVTLDQLLFAGSSIAYKKCEAGDASTLCERGWDWSSINELEFDQLRRSMVFCPDSGKEIVWWRLKGDRSQPLLRGPGGWITLWYSDVLPQRINKSLAQETETSIVVKRDKRQLRELLEEQLGSSDVSPFTATARSLFAEDLLDAILTESVE